MLSGDPVEEGERYLQVVGQNEKESLEKARVVLLKNDFRDYGVNLVQFPDEGCLKEGTCREKKSTKWVFEEACSPWRKNITPTTKISPLLTSLDSLRFEGFYNYQRRYWERYYITTSGIVINLLEDVPETGGQNCLWSAGLVMSRCTTRLIFVAVPD